MNAEIREILECLKEREDYVIWAGFAQYAHLGIVPSADLDIMVKSDSVRKEISKEFQSNGWVKKDFSGFYKNHDKLEKKGTTFDIVYSENASRLFFENIVKKELYSFNLIFISIDLLFITKLGQLTVQQRSSEKRERDWKAVNLSRGKINVANVRRIISQLPDSFWTVGWIS